MATPGKRKGQRTARTTFKELCSLSRRQANRNLMQRARRASRLARAVHGKARRQFYDVKHRCLSRLIGSGGVRPEADHFRCPGLISVRVPGAGRLHTHEAWMESSVKRVDHRPAGLRARGAWRAVNN